MVTGGTRGIGYGIANCLARDGYDLLLGYNANAERAATAARDLEQRHGVKVATWAGELAKLETLERAFEVVQSEFGGRLTVFVHNAGLWPGLTTARTAEQPGDFSDETELDFFNYFYKVYPLAFKQGMMLAAKCEGFAHAVAISMPGCNTTQVPRVESEAAGQAKATMEYLVRTNALRFGPDNVTVNTVIPGIVESEAWDKCGTELKSLADSGVRDRPLARWGTALDVGEAVAFLCSPRGAFITGAALPVDGGRHLVGTMPAARKQVTAADVAAPHAPADNPIPAGGSPSPTLASG